MLESDYFTLFGLHRIYPQDLAKIKQTYLALQQKAHPDKHIDGSLIEKQLAVEYAAFINDGFRTLIDPLKRAVYLLKLHGVDAIAETQTSFPMDFLMEQISFREVLENIAADPQQQKVLSDMQHEIDIACQLLKEQFSGYLELPIPNLDEAKLCVQKLQFYHRLNEEITQLQQILVI